MKKSYTTLYSKKATNKILEWNIKVEKNKDKSAKIVIKYGQQNGKIITNERVITEGKNIGKSNETTPYEQAILEATSKWNQKKNRNGYVEILKIEEDNKLDLSKIRPMLANKYENKKKHIKYPCYVQPKLDGIRCLAYKKNNEIILMSRNNKLFANLDHIKTILLKNDFDYILDGELFTKNLEFGEISGLVRKEILDKDDSEKIKKIQYHVYDIININNMNQGFNERFQILNNFIKNNKIINIVKTEICDSHSSILEKYDNYVKDDYEGIMIRNFNGKYKLNYRSNDLLKLKPFHDADYKIVNFKEGDGRDKGCVIWICENKNKQEFNVRPKGTLEERRKLFKNGSKYIGKLLTVRFQEIMDDIPRFGVGITIRDYE